MKKLVVIFCVLFLISLIPNNFSVSTNTNEVLFGISKTHILGTDYLGRDIFLLMKYGFIRTSIVVLVGSVIGFGLGVILGLIGGYSEGIILVIIKSFSDIATIVPSIIVAIIIASIIGLNPISAGIALGFCDIGIYSNQVASLTKRMKYSEFIVMEELLLIPRKKIIISHILPNIIESVSSLFANKASGLIIRYASLSFIGLGTDITKPDWGTLLYEYRIYMIDKPMLLLWPSLGILIFALFFQALFDNNKRFKGGLHV